MLGYLRPDGSIEPPRSVFGEGWYRTGDVVCIDNEGYVTIVGRVKRFAKVAGEMVSLEITEGIAREASPQFAHAAVSSAGAARGEMVVLFTEDAQLRREQLQQAARAMGAPELALPRRIVFLPRIPLLGNGKKDYVTLTRMAAEEKAE